MALEHGVMLSKTSPAFLHANSTSHTWCFSAIAEIIDNAYDPDVGATELQIDRIMIKDMVCLSFTDNGAGMTPEKLHRMLSFGYCDKVEIRGHKPVGQYGNGFKSGSMRLGKDALVLTKCKATWSVGFLSQTFLAKINADTVLVPIITFDKTNNRLVRRDDTDGSLKSIFSHSILSTMSAILKEYNTLNGYDSGTRIIIYNLKRGAGEMLELDFDSNPKDIINSEHHEFDPAAGIRLVKEYTPEYRRSLREYCSILFLKPKMKILIRGEKVRTKLISKTLHKTEVALYRPRNISKPIKIIFGFSSTNEDFGLMMYHRNRLIKAYERVGCQRNQNCQGIGVVGIVEVDFLEPTHNKQDFNKTDKYNACMNILAQKLNDYCQEKSCATDSSQTQSESSQWTWAQCDNPYCLKWRRLPPGINSETLPNKWFCYMNMDPTHNRCEIEEEPEDEDKLIEQGRNYEKHLKKHKSQKESAQKQNETVQSVQENGVSRVELEQARQQLEQAKRREEEQKKIIENLQRQKHEMEMQQRRLGDAVMNNVSSVTSINNIVQNGHQNTPAAAAAAASAAGDANAQRKRKSFDPGQKNLKKQRQTSSVDSLNRPVNPEPPNIQEDDETLDVKPQLVVKFPPRSKKSGDVIVIDSDSEAESSAAKEQKNCSSEETSNDRIVLQTLDKQQIREKNGKNYDGNKSSSSKKAPPRSTRSVRTQTMIPDNNLSNAGELLNSLRSNVVKLLQIILPNMEVFANIALENVDNALIEVLRVNDVTISDQGTTTSADQATKTEPVGDEES